MLDLTPNLTAPNINRMFIDKFYPDDIANSAEVWVRVLAVGGAQYPRVGHWYKLKLRNSGVEGLAHDPLATSYDKFLVVTSVAISGAFGTALDAYRSAVGGGPAGRRAVEALYSSVAWSFRLPPGTVT